MKVCSHCGGTGYIVEEINKTTNDVAQCSNCRYSSVEVYLSDPPKIKCSKDNNYHFCDWLCPNYKSK